MSSIKDSSKLTDTLLAGQTITITKRGKPFGVFRKAPGNVAPQMPDFATNVARMTYSPEAVEEIVRQVLDGSVS